MNAKLFQIVQSNGDFSVQEWEALSREDLEFLLWALRILRKESEFMDALQSHYYKQHFLRVTAKLEAIAIDAK
jgi:hypothetical protein